MTARKKPRKPKLAIRNAASEGEVEILLFEDIGEGFFGGISAKAVVDQLSASKDAETVRVRINSSGGSVFDAFAIYNALKSHAGRIIVQIEGMALSAASMIAMAGDEIEMAANAMFMLHEPKDAVHGTAKEMRSTADLLDKVRANIVSAYVARAGTNAEQVSVLMTEETWFTADEALAAGFVDRISEGRAIAAHVDLEQFQSAPEWARKRLLSLQKRKPTMSKKNKAQTASNQEEVPVQAPIGTCVMPDGTMEQVTEASCQALGGNWSAQTAPAAPAVQEPEAPAGTCALPDGTTEQLSESACSARGGTWTAASPTDQDDDDKDGTATAKAVASPLATAKGLKALGATNDFIVKCLESEMTLDAARDSLLKSQGETIQALQTQLRASDPKALQLRADGSSGDADADVGDTDADEARWKAEWRRDGSKLRAEGITSEAQYIAGERALKSGHARIMD